MVGYIYGGTMVVIYISAVLSKACHRSSYDSDRELWNEPSYNQGRGYQINDAGYTNF